MKPYRWGKFQGWVLVAFGVIGLLVGRSPFLLGRFGIIGAAIQMGAGIGVIARYKTGVIAYYVCAVGIAFDFLLHVAFLDMTAIILSAPFLCWWLLPSVLYYPKRWREFTDEPPGWLRFKGISRAATNPVAGSQHPPDN